MSGDDASFSDKSHFSIALGEYEGAAVRKPDDIPCDLAEEGAAFDDALARNRAERLGEHNFLILSAPFGPFARELAARLRQSGATVRRVLLNAGDVFDWGLGEARIFRGRLEDWQAWIEALFLRDRVTDVVTYGDSSPYARAALASAWTLGVRVHVLEQGYFRPDWVTLERDGVNAQSRLPRSPDWFREHPAAKQAAAAKAVDRTMASAVRHIFIYHAMTYLGAVAFPHFRFGYRDCALLQAAGHAGRFLSQRMPLKDDRDIHERVMSSAGSKFLLLLQRPGDSQLWRHSGFEDVTLMIRTVCEDFAANAPADAHLLIRPHPLDPGLIPHRRNVAAIARDLGLENRVQVVDYEKLHNILPQMAGVVCVNSSGGLAGVEFGVPTITLGKALYDMPGLTHQAGLERFWTEPEKPDAAQYEAFRRVMMALTQVNGSYATAAGRALAVPTIAARLGAPEAAVE